MEVVVNIMGGKSQTLQGLMALLEILASPLSQKALIRLSCKVHVTHISEVHVSHSCRPLVSDTLGPD
ncbi:MAG: hypothetical protein WAW52_07000 [Methanothrix sp.]